MVLQGRKSPGLRPVAMMGAFEDPIIAFLGFGASERMALSVATVSGESGRAAQSWFWNEWRCTMNPEIVGKTCRLDGRKSRSGFRPCTRPEQAISCYNPVQVHGPRREWKRKEDHETLLGPMCTIKPWTLRPACTSVVLSTLHNAACQLHTLWLRPAVVTTDSIRIR